MSNKIVGYWWEGDKFDIPIIKKENGKYYRQYPKIEDEEEFPREVFQYAMTNPWDKLRFYHEEKNNQFIANYHSIMYDWFSCRISGFGDSLDEAIVDLIENILDVMQGYDEEKVENFIDNYYNK